MNKIESRITFKIKKEYYLELLTIETMKLLGSIKKKTDKHKNGENVPHLEITEVVLVHCNVKNSDYEQDSRVLHIIVPNYLFDQLPDISLYNFILLKTFNSEFSYVEVWLLINVLNRLR